MRVMAVTNAERKALVFLASLLGLGAAVRLAGALRHSAPTPGAAASARALADQVAAVDSVRTRARADRVRTSRRRASRGPVARPKADKPPSDTFFVIDVDRASAEELERLPRVGPALAKRIVSDREEHGAFGSLTELMRVKGIGPKLKQRIASHVTFSASVRPSTALSVSPGSVPRAGRSPPPG
jgi:competence protein ComEA